MTASATTLAQAPNRFLVGTYMLTLVTSAALLFWLQPMIAKFILPRVGGAPAVWNTAMMFFQAALLAGYIYAHVLSRHATIRVQVAVHITLLIVCVAWLPIGIDPHSTPPADSNPSWWVLTVLALGVGIPFTVVSGSAPLLQNWFATSGHKDADNPYFLYAASNVGSMTALFCFPLVAEPLLDLNGQSWAWSLTFGALVVLTALSGGFALGHSPNIPLRNWDVPRDDVLAPTNLHRFMWLALVMASTSLMLGITTHITTDVAAVPLLWVIPLALYLLTYVIVFGRRPLITADRAVGILFASLVLFGIIWLIRQNSSMWLMWVAALLAIYFITVLTCHAELARLKPHKAWLTEFYLWIALGGVLGGIFNALVAPILFQSATEFVLMMGVAVALILAARAVSREASPKAMLALAMGCIVLPVGAEHGGLLLPSSVLTRERNFFGVLSVVEDRDLNARVLRYGTTVHGMRNLSPGKELAPTGYYGRNSAFDDVMRIIMERPKSGDIGAIGLGVGSISCYPTNGRSITFYEINPAVTEMAEHPDYFGFLKGCGSDYQIVHGDGRLKLSEEPNGRFDFIFLDAFTSDSIPVHLLTREAMSVYIDKLTPDGVVLAHISNNHLALAPVVAAITRDLNLVALHRQGASKAPQGMTNRVLNAQTHMVAIARHSEDLGSLPEKADWQPLIASPDSRTWTDSYTNVIGTLRIFNQPTKKAAP